MNPLRLLWFDRPTAQPTVIHFSSVVDGKVDRPNGIIRGVSLITSGVTARGHDLEIDSTTVQQLLACAVAKKQVPVKLNHKSGIVEVCGYLDNFRTEGEKLLGDWHLLKSHGEYETTLEKAERMPGCFGLSAAFIGKEEKIKSTGKKAARCQELLSVDCVTQPAANPDGLFEARTDELHAFDTTQSGQMNSGESSNGGGAAQSGNADVMALLTKINERLDQQQQVLDGLQNGGGNDDEPATLDELNQLAKLSDADLTKHGLTRAEVTQAIQDATAGEGEGGEGEGAGEGADEGEGAAAAAPSGGTEMGAIQDVITYFENKVRLAVDSREAAEVEHAFQVLDQKVTLLAAELEAAREQLRVSGTGTALPASSEANMLFEAKDQNFAGTFEHEVSAKVQELQAKDPKLTETAAQAQAVQFCVKKFPGLYGDYRKRGGKIELSRK